MTKHSHPLVQVVPHSLKAVLNEQVGKGKHHSFNVEIEVQAEIDWKIELVAATPQGINPLVKLLTFHVKKPTGAHSNAIAKRTVQYSEAPPHAQYSDVTVENGDTTISAKVARIV